jgi:hypothetical protein
MSCQKNLTHSQPARCKAPRFPDFAFYDFPCPNGVAPTVAGRQGNSVLGLLGFADGGRENPLLASHQQGAVGLAAIIASVYKRNWNAWHSAVVMNDKRDTQQQKVIRAGTISFDGSGIDCLVRNMSVAGANLEVESQIGIPSSFDLVINVERSNHHCHVVWRKARRIGIAFD